MCRQTHFACLDADKTKPILDFVNVLVKRYKKQERDGTNAISSDFTDHDAVCANYFTDTHSTRCVDDIRGLEILFRKDVIQALAFENLPSWNSKGRLRNNPSHDSPRMASIGPRRVHEIENSYSMQL